MERIETRSFLGAAHQFPSAAIRCFTSCCRGKFLTVFKSNENSRGSTAPLFWDSPRVAESSFSRSSKVLQTVDFRQCSSSLFSLVLQMKMGTKGQANPTKTQWCGTTPQVTALVGAVATEFFQSTVRWNKMQWKYHMRYRALQAFANFADSGVATLLNGGLRKSTQMSTGSTGHTVEVFSWHHSGKPESIRHDAGSGRRGINVFSRTGLLVVRLGVWLICCGVVAVWAVVVLVAGVWFPLWHLPFGSFLFFCFSVFQKKGRRPQNRSRRFYPRVRFFRYTQVFWTTCFTVFWQLSGLSWSYSPPVSLVSIRQEPISRINLIQPLRRTVMFCTEGGSTTGAIYFRRGHRGHKFVRSVALEFEATLRASSQHALCKLFLDREDRECMPEAASSKVRGQSSWSEGTFQFALAALKSHVEVSAMAQNDLQPSSC